MKRNLQSIQADPVPSDIDWEPLRNSGNVFRTRKARIADSQRLVFIPTIISIFFYIAGIAFSIFICRESYINPVHNPAHPANHIMGYIFSPIFLLAAIIALWLGTRPVVFDKTTNEYYRGWRIYSKTAGIRVSLEDICSIQILSHLFRGGMGYQMNLVLNNSKRIYIVGHRDIKQIRRDAKLLSEFLNAPIW